MRRKRAARATSSGAATATGYIDFDMDIDEFII